MIRKTTLLTIIFALLFVSFSSAYVPFRPTGNIDLAPNKTIVNWSVAGNCAGSSFVSGMLRNGSFNCSTPSGSGDITGVQGDNFWIYNGSASGDIFLSFNSSKLVNATSLYCGNITGATSNLCMITSGGGGGGINTISALDDWVIVNNGSSANLTINGTKINATYTTFGYVNSLTNWSSDRPNYVNFSSLSGGAPNVTLVGVTYLSLSGQALTAALVNLANHVTGLLNSTNLNKNSSWFTDNGQTLTLNETTISLYDEDSRITDLNTSLTANDSAQALILGGLLSSNSTLFTNASNQQAQINGLISSNGTLFTNASAQQTAIGNLEAANVTVQARIASVNTTLTNNDSAQQTSIGNLHSANVTAQARIDSINATKINTTSPFNNASGDINVTGTFNALVLKANCVAITGSAALCDGDDNAGAGSYDWNFTNGTTTGVVTDSGAFTLSAGNNMSINCSGTTCTFNAIDTTGGVGGGGSFDFWVVSNSSYQKNVTNATIVNLLAGNNISSIIVTNSTGIMNITINAIDTNTENGSFNQTLTDTLYYPRNTNPQTYYNSTTFTDYYPLLTNTLEYINRTTGIWLGNTSIIAGLVSSNSTVLRNNTYAVFSTVNATSGNFGNTNLTTTQIIEGINLYFTSTRAGDAVGNSTIIRNFSNVILNQVNITTANISQLNVGTTNLTTGQITETSNLYFTSTRAGDAVGNSSIIRNFSSVIFNRANITTANISQLNVGTTNLTTAQITENINLYFTSLRAGDAVGNSTILRNHSSIIVTTANITTANISQLNVGTTNLTTAQLTETSNLFFTSTRAGDAVGNASILRNFSNAIFNQVNITTANISRLNAATTNLTTTQIAEGTNRYWTSNLANITGSGLPNYMVKWHNATHLNTSVVQDYGTIVNISANLTVGVGTNNTANISVVGNNLLLQPVMYVGINTSTPTHTLTVRGNVNFTGLPAGSGSLYLCITAGGQVYTAVTNCVTG